MNAFEHYQKGNLADAVTAALDEVKKNPTDSGKRTFLAELLCLTGDLERADKQLDALAQEDQQALMEISLFRQLIRAEQARQQFFSDGRLPEFLDNAVTADMRKHIEAAILVREKKPAEAVAMLASADEERPSVTGVCNGQAFDGFRDLDDLTASFFEVLTSTGKYYWIPLERVESVEFRAPVRPRDLLWRRAHMICRNGPDGEVFLAALYAGAARESDALRLGRATEWRGEATEPVRGVGQRIYLVGETDRTIMELETLTVNGPASPSTADQPDA